MAKEVIIGIDLGTTNSEAAYLEGGRPVIIPSAEGSTFGGKMFPSVVAFTKDGERIVGDPAKRQAVLNPENTIMHIKRKMGTKHRVSIKKKKYSPEEISAMVLQKIKADSEAHLGVDIEKAVITVPAYFNDNQRQAIQYGTGDLIGMIDCDLDTDLAWDITTGDPSVVIAILDTGVDLDHPDLVNNMVNGYNFVNDSLPPDDQFDHGTPCAGIAAATINNDIGIAGVCPNCSIMSVKVLNDDGSGDWGIISEGIVWASDNDADVISLSLGGGQYQEVLESAVNYSVANGSVTIAASGNINNNMDFYPASYDQCIAVGAMSPCCERKQGVNSCDAEPGWGSTYGDQIDFVAPGVRIFATAKRAGYWTDFNGTSSACPHVAGIAGLMLSKNPYLNPETVREMLRQSADDIGDPGYDIETGYGKVNAYESILLVPNPVSGDINLDGTVNISDVVILVDEILFGSYITSGDINADGINNINDIMLLIQIILI